MFSFLRHLGLSLLFPLLWCLAPATATQDAPATATQGSSAGILDLEQMPDLNQAIQSDKWSQLRRALPELEKGANPLVLDGESSVSLGEIIIISRAWNCLREMLRSGLRPTLEMVELAGELENLDTYKSLLKAKGPMSPRQSLELTGKALSIALQYGADPNATTSVEKLTPLMTHSDPADIALLLRHKADPNGRDLKGRTPLFYQRDTKALALLLQAGADINALDEHQHSPMDYWKNDEKRHQYLLSKGGRTNAPLDLIQITQNEDYTIALNDLDNYAYLIINEGKSNKREDLIVYYLAHRFPRAEMRQTEDWETFVKWINEIQAGSLIHRYERCRETFSLPEDWEQEHQLTDIFAKLGIQEGETRIYCVCDKNKDGESHL